MIKEEILKEIAELKEKTTAANDAVKVTKDIAITVASKVQVKFNEFSQTESIDARLQVLIDTCREVVQYTEDTHNQLEIEINNLNLQVSTLETLLSKLQHHFELPHKALEPKEDLIDAEPESEEISEGEKK